MEALGKEKKSRTPSIEPLTNVPCGNNASGLNGGMVFTAGGDEPLPSMVGNDENDARTSTCATTDTTLGLFAATVDTRMPAADTETHAQQTLNCHTRDTRTTY
jgi:hypothetical protein